MGVPDPIVVYEWVQNLDCMRKRQILKDSTCVGIQEKNQNAALSISQMVYIQVHKPL